MNPYAAYKRQSVSTMTPLEIVVKLYSETERELNRAIPFIEQKNYEQANNSLSRALELVNALRSVLDLSLPIGKNLDSLYAYFEKQIILANTKKDINIIKPLLPQIAELKDAFAQISAMPKDQIAASAANAAKA